MKHPACAYPRVWIEEQVPVITHQLVEVRAALVGDIGLMLDNLFDLNLQKIRIEL
jgi:hypothetical protein